MGLIDKAVTRRTVAPTAGQLGPWYDRAAAESGFLSARELQGLAAARAILGVATGKATSNYRTQTGRVAAASASGESTKSLLRSEGGVGRGSLISCGAHNPLQGFVRDWELAMSVGEGARRAWTCWATAPWTAPS